ncbi:MAG: VRR-NUC domain-containing protein [Clostridia bacterium]|nr:VRR-NUC domain-containing protein [Clostridia bacterium]
MVSTTLKRTEHGEQAYVIQWARTNAYREPALNYLFAIANGARLSHRMSQNGTHYSPEANKLRSEGMLAGVPDLCLPAARRGYNGLYIEMKIGKNKTSEQQDAVIKYLREAGYQVEVCYGGDKAVEVLIFYLGL